MTAHPKEFFEQFVKRAYDEYRAAPLDEHRALTAVHWVNVMAERMWHYFRDRDPAVVYGASSPGNYREALADKECDDVRLVRDIDDGAKHDELTRSGRRVTTADQTRYEPTGWDQLEWAEAFPSAWIVVRLDVGSQRSLSTVLGNVMIMWEWLLGAP